jgi:uncharacterized membrane protein YfbV (UPF0208 family)
MTSPDGVNWTSQTPAESGDTFNNICYSPEFGMFVIAAVSATTYQIQASIDGINWVGKEASTNNAWTSTAWSATLGIFASVSDNGTNRVQISTYVQKLIGW